MTRVDDDDDDVPKGADENVRASPTFRFIYWFFTRPVRARQRLGYGNTRSFKARSECPSHGTGMENSAV